MSPLGATGVKVAITLLGPGVGGSLPWGRAASDELGPLLCTRFACPRAQVVAGGDKQVGGPLPVLRDDAQQGPGHPYAAQQQLPLSARHPEPLPALGSLGR